MHMKKLCLGAALASAIPATPARADVSAYMTAWDSIPQVQITQGRANNCEDNRTVFGPAAMTKGFRQSFPGTGNRGEDICWRRTSDPKNPRSGWTIWTRCSSDGECEIR
jgi:hypothetical protein